MSTVRVSLHRLASIVLRQFCAGSSPPGDESFASSSSISFSIDECQSRSSKVTIQASGEARRGKYIPQWLKQLAGKVGIPGENGERLPPGAEARANSAGFTRGLKPLLPPEFPIYNCTISTMRVASDTARPISSGTHPAGVHGVERNGPMWKKCISELL
jgi:hypothetical protein